MFKYLATLCLVSEIIEPLQRVSKTFEYVSVQWILVQFYLREPVEKELHYLIEMDITEPVDGLTPRL